LDRVRHEIDNLPFEHMDLDLDLLIIRQLTSNAQLRYQWASRHTCFAPIHRHRISSCLFYAGQ